NIMPRRGPVETTQNVHECGFPGTARAHERYEFAAFDFQRYAPHGGHFHLSSAIGLMHIDQPNECTVVHVYSLQMTEPHGKRRGPPNGFAGGDGAAVVEPSSAVTTRSPSFKRSTTSVRIPSLFPFLIALGGGRLAPNGKT